MSTSNLLLEFSDKAGVSGLKEAENFAIKLLEKYGSVKVTPLGSIICSVKEAKENQPHILLDAHIDEIGLIVTFIDETGFLRVGQVGGTDPRLLAATRVTVHTESEELVGVICSVPPHLSADDKKENLPADKIYIDVGLTKEEADKKIKPGDRVTFHSSPAKMLGNNVSGKTLDDRAGCISLVKALDYLGDDIPYGLTVMFSNMEEIGGQGAKTATFAVNPTHALAVDVGFAKVPSSPSDTYGELGKGPMIAFAPILSNDISQKLVNLAKENDIPFQYEISGGRTGTNADSMVTIREGVACGLISIPQRYMHMPIEMLSVDDVENTGKLIAAWVKDIGKAVK